MKVFDRVGFSYIDAMLAELGHDFSMIMFKNVHTLIKI